MVCSHCNCSGHNKRTCDFIAISPSEKRVAQELNALLPALLPALKAKKFSKPIEGLNGSPAMMAMFKEPKVVKAKKFSKPIEGLNGSPAMMAMFKEPKVVKVSVATKTCSACGQKGHNSRTCSSACVSCSPPKSFCFAGLSAEQAVHMTRILDCTPPY
jgi:hypothetical protein